MTEHSAENAYQRLDSIIVRLLLTLRAEKQIDNAAMTVFYSTCKELETCLGQDAIIDKKLAGIILQIYFAFLENIRSMDRHKHIFLESIKVKTLLDRIFPMDRTFYAHGCLEKTTLSNEENAASFFEGIFTEFCRDYHLGEKQLGALCSWEKVVSIKPHDTDFVSRRLVGIRECVKISGSLLR